jgi:hypothetical protein
MAAQAQFAGLSRLYNLQCLSLPAEDRSGLDELLDFIADHIDASVGNSAAAAEADIAAAASAAAGADDAAVAAAPAAQPRRVHLLGESMGGMMALAGACGARTCREAQPCFFARRPGPRVRAVLPCARLAR